MINEEPRTIKEALEENFRRNPSKDYVIAYDKHLSYEEVYRLSNGLAWFFVTTGMGKGSMVGLVLPRVPELIISFMAMAGIGMIPVPVNYTLSKREIEDFIFAADLAAVIIHQKLMDSFNVDLLARKGVKVIVVGGEPGRHVPWEEACIPSDTPVPNDVGLEDIAYLNYTTGSTGNPKGAMTTHDNIYWNTRASVEAMGIGPGDVHLIMFASFAHPHELFARPLYTGGTVVLLEEINPKTISRTIEEKSVTCMMGLAPMYDMIAGHCGDRHFDKLRFGESGGMYTHPSILESFMKNFGVPILPVWGSTETTGIAIANTPEENRQDGSAGRACLYYEVRVVDDQGEDVKTGEIGELAFKGRGVISGYINNDSFATRDGWYLSGDLGRRDEDGYYYFVETKSGMMKVAGLKVYPLQVELAIMRHPGVKEIAVIGVDDKLRGVVPKAYIVPNEGYELTPKEVQEFCKEKMAHYMIPRKVEIIDKLPKIGSGKINKKILRKIN